VSDKKLVFHAEMLGAPPREHEEVCTTAREAVVDNFYVQYDGLIDLYHEKFAKPGSRCTRLRSRSGPSNS